MEPRGLLREYGGTAAIATRYGWSVRTVRRKIHRGVFPASRDGLGDFRIRYADVEKYLASNVVRVSSNAEAWVEEKLQRPRAPDLGMNKKGARG